MTLSRITNIAYTHSIYNNCSYIVDPYDTTINTNSQKQKRYIRQRHLTPSQDGHDGHDGLPAPGSTNKKSDTSFCFPFPLTPPPFLLFSSTRKKSFFTLSDLLDRPCRCHRSLPFPPVHAVIAIAHRVQHSHSLSALFQLVIIVDLNRISSNSRSGAFGPCASIYHA